MASLNETPSSNRLHIGVFGKTNSGKSSLINAFTGQEVSIVAEVAGTTTDPVYKAMEIHPLGPCIIIDTAGFDDESELGEQRVEKTALAAEKADVAILVVGVDTIDSRLFKQITQEVTTGECDFAEAFPEEAIWYQKLKERKTPVLFVVSKEDKDPELAHRLVNWMEAQTRERALAISTQNRDSIEQLKPALTRLLPEEFGADFITGDLVQEDDLVLLVMPQDIQAPKGRLILPQVQTIRELLDRKCMVVSVTTDKLEAVLPLFTKSPKLIITDSQVFSYVYEHKPEESMLTSFSVLFAAYKGDLPYYLEGAGIIDKLTEQSRVLIAECCTHAPLTEDIGREKLPRMLRKRIGAGLTIDMVSGTDFPDDPSAYDLIIQCGACMFNRKYVLSRVEKAKSHGVPMTNYGVTIAHLTGILPKISTT